MLIWLSGKKFKVSKKLSCDLEIGSANMGFLRWVRIMSFTISTVRILKKPCAIELNKVILCLRLYSIEIVLYSFILSVRVACTKINVEKYIPHWVKNNMDIRTVQWEHLKTM